MASIRYRNSLYQVQIRMKNLSLSQSFPTLQSARRWASCKEARIIRESDPSYRYRPHSLAEVLENYQRRILIDKGRSHPDSWIVQAFLKLGWIGKPLISSLSRILQTTVISVLKSSRLPRFIASSLSFAMRSTWQVVNGTGMCLKGFWNASGFASSPSKPSGG